MKETAYYGYPVRIPQSLPPFEGALGSPDRLTELPRTTIGQLVPQTRNVDAAKALAI